VALKSATFAANRTHALMAAFLALDVGDLVEIKEDRTDIDGYYYIQAVSFDIKPGGVILFTWKLIDAFTMALIVASFASAGGTDGDGIINYGRIPSLENNMQRSVVVWAYRTTNHGTAVMFGEMSDDAGMIFYMTGSGVPALYAKYDGGGGIGAWTGEASAPSVWRMHTMTMDFSSASNDPKFYLNEAARVVTESITPTGNYKDETGVPITIGNINTATVDNWGFVGHLKDVRVYNRILTDQEVADLYSGVNITDGLIFQGPAVRARDLDYFDGLVPSKDDRIGEKINSFMGKSNSYTTTHVIPYP